MKRCLVLPLVFMFFAVSAFAAEPIVDKPATKIAPITKIDGLKLKASIFKAASRKKPLVLKSIKDATDHFSKEDLAKLKKQVDFSKQYVLIFAWKGSGGDRLNHTILESSPEQVKFKYQGGRTRDYRPHVYIYVVRNDVKWTGP